MKRALSLPLGMFVALAFAGVATPSHADNFVSYSLTGDNGYNLVGIDASGDVAIESPFGCSAKDPNRCYEIFSNGVLVSESDTLGGFTPDDGSPCAFVPLPGENLVGRSVCNNGSQVAGVLNNGEAQILFLSADGSNLAALGSADFLFVNSTGDFVLVDGAHDEIDEFMVTSEPGTLLLFLTGALGVAALSYRKRHAVL